MLDGRLFVFCDSAIDEVDVSSGLLPNVRLHPPAEPLFVGGWVKVGVECSGGVTIDDLEFDIDGGPLAGAVSYSRDATYDPAKPDIMLLAGTQPGKWALRAIERTGGTVVAEESFEVTTEWPDEAEGPAVQFVGESQPSSSGRRGAAARPGRRTWMCSRPQAPGEWRSSSSIPHRPDTRRMHRR